MPDEAAVRRRALGSFLRRRRLTLQPSPREATLTVRRRTPGLRREEVAQRAGLSADWIARLEQGRDVRLSPETAKRLARALELTAIETEHLFALSMPYALPECCVAMVPRAFELIVSALGNNPAYVHDPLYDVLARNRAADELFDGFGERRLQRANLLQFIFIDPAAGRLRNREHHARRLVAHFRLLHDRNAGNRAFETLAAKLRAASPEFRTYWEYHEVLARGGGVETFDHPLLGALSFTYSTFQAPDVPGLSLCLYIAQPGQPALGSGLQAP